MFGPLQRIFALVVREGNLEVVDSAGVSHRFGDETGAPIRVLLADRRLEKQLAVFPQLALGEGYMEDRFRLERGSIYDFLALMLSNAERTPFPWLMVRVERLRRLRKRFDQFNPISRARRNVAHHYDIDGAVYDLFLDLDRQYSCAYFAGEEDLAAAQARKKRHIAAKLDLKPGQRVLDIGSGWGGLGLYLARHCGVKVEGVTLSQEQLKVSEARARAQSLDREVSFALKDYREVVGPFERIVSVGMFEHVGVNHYQTYFSKIRDLLPASGVALVHSIGRSGEPSVTNPFIAKYIFPGGYIPALSEVLKAVERSGLMVADIEILRLHYAKTLRHWRERFQRQRAEAARIRDERFCRMWEFYLAASEASFRHQGLMVFQLQLVRSMDALPLTRDYMQAAEQDLVQREAALERYRMAGE